MAGRNEIIRRLAVKLNGTTNNVTDNDLRQISQICDGLVDVLAETLDGGDKITWKGFITAEVVERDERSRIHPVTREIIVSPKKKFIKCKMSKQIIDRINGSGGK